VANSTKKKGPSGVVAAAPNSPLPIEIRGRRKGVDVAAPARKPAKRTSKKNSRKRAGKRAEPAPPTAAATHDVSDRLTRLLAGVLAVRAGNQTSPRTQKLLKSGVAKMAQKLVEEAAETAIDAVRGERAGLINESADLLFNLVVLWSALDVTPAEIWAEMDRRELALGLAEKLPKPLDMADL